MNFLYFINNNLKKIKNKFYIINTSVNFYRKIKS